MTKVNEETRERVKAALKAKEAHERARAALKAKEALETFETFEKEMKACGDRAKAMYKKAFVKAFKEVEKGG